MEVKGSQLFLSCGFLLFYCWLVFCFRMKIFPACCCAYNQRFCASCPLVALARTIRENNEFVKTQVPLYGGFPKLWVPFWGSQ